MTVQTPEFLPPEPFDDPPEWEPDRPPRPAQTLPGLGERLTWLSGLVLAISAFTGWYVGSGEGLRIAVIGWHTGVLGKLVFFIGLALIALGAVATIFVLLRLITIPQDLLPADGRGVGIWVSLVAALLAIGAGIVRAGEEM